MEFDELKFETHLRLPSGLFARCPEQTRQNWFQTSEVKSALNLGSRSSATSDNKTMNTAEYSVFNWVYISRGQQYPLAIARSKK